MINVLHSGEDTIKMLKDIFNIDDKMPIKSIVLRAECDDVAILEVESYLSTKDVDINAVDISDDSMVDESRYQVTIRKIE